MNQTILIGNAGGKAELRTTTKGVKVAFFSLATTERYRDAQGEVKKITDWHEAAAFGPLADVIAQLVDKGAVVFVSGQLHSKAYIDRDENARVSTTLHIEKFELLKGGKKDDTADTPAQEPVKSATPKESDLCPKCKTGHLVKKSGSGKPFLACDQYPTCKNTYPL